MNEREASEISSVENAVVDYSTVENDASEGRNERA